MDMCLLCLELRKDTQDVIKVESTKWREENIEKLIEKHFWSMKYITCNAWLCATCWQIISEFHTFYIRIEDAHSCLTSLLKTEMQDNTEDCGSQIESVLKTDTNPLLYGEQFELELPMDQASATVSSNVAEIPADSKILAVVKAEVQNEEETKIQELGTSSKRSSTRKRRDPLKRASSPNLRSKDPRKRTSKKKTKTPKKHKSVMENVDETEQTDMAEIYNSDSDSDIRTDVDEGLDSSERKSRSNPYYKPSTKYQGQDEFVSENFKINCGICQATMKTFHDICKHSAKEHKQRGYVKCCNKKFFRRSILVEHIHWHLDPEYFKCNNCGKVMADRRCLNIHARVHEQLDRTHICDICGKGFARPLALQRHKLTHLPDEEKKFSCDQCGKNFGDNNLLSNHIRSVHLNKYALVCDICGRRMRSKDVFERHMLQHEGLPIPTVSCDVCGLKMTDPRGLKRHKEIQHPEGGRMEYKCHICSKVSPTLKAHRKHVQYKHELGYDFKCTICDKAFKRSISLTEHMATHTGSVLYTCPYCPKTFNSNANMHSHRKKSHPKEWEEACREKYSGNLPPNYKPVAASHGF